MAWRGGAPVPRAEPAAVMSECRRADSFSPLQSAEECGSIGALRQRTRALVGTNLWKD